MNVVRLNFLDINHEPEAPEISLLTQLYKTPI